MRITPLLLAALSLRLIIEVSGIMILLSSPPATHKFEIAGERELFTEEIRHSFKPSHPTKSKEIPYLLIISLLRRTMSSSCCLSSGCAFGVKLDNLSLSCTTTYLSSFLSLCTLVGRECSGKCLIMSSASRATTPGGDKYGLASGLGIFKTCPPLYLCTRCSAPLPTIPPISAGSISGKLDKYLCSKLVSAISGAELYHKITSKKPVQNLGYLKPVIKWPLTNNPIRYGSTKCTFRQRIGKTTNG